MSLTQIYNTGYEVIFVAFSGIVLAQFVKCFLHLLVKRSLDLRLFTTTGGMPSSHSAGVMGLSTAVGLIRGFDSIEFAIALGYAFIVMYDAAGVRRAVFTRFYLSFCKQNEYSLHLHEILFSGKYAVRFR